MKQNPLTNYDSEAAFCFELKNKMKMTVLNFKLCIGNDGVKTRDQVLRWYLHHCVLTSPVILCFFKKQMFKVQGSRFFIICHIHIHTLQLSFIQVVYLVLHFFCFELFFLTMIDDLLNFFCFFSLSLHAHVNPLSGLNEPVFQVKKKGAVCYFRFISGEKNRVSVN